MHKDFSLLESGSVTSPTGYCACGITAGFKRSGAPDAALIVSDTPANCGGAFTSCLFAAAPVQLCRKKLARGGLFRAFFLNSGNANACTGENGLANAETTCQWVADKLGCTAKEVLVASTGRIGVQMPMDVVQKGVELAGAALSKDGGIRAAEAIMTTDSVPKHACVTLELGGKKVTIGAISKGAGMIAPSLKVLHATMLCCITTDAGLENKDLAALLDCTTECSFNRITVDGDMSTNDTVIFFANGASGVKLSPGTPDFEVFAEALTALLQNLAHRMVYDGEGASKFVEVKVIRAAKPEDARLCAEAVANSLLCKTAWYGCDPNWGRVVAALGYSKAQFNPDKVDVFYDGIPVVKQGGDAGTTEEELADVMHKREFTVLVDLNAGDAEYWVWTSDISHEYVKINADYHT